MKVMKSVGRTLYIDFYAGFHNNKPDYDTGRNLSYVKHRMMKALDPYCKLLGKPKKYASPEDLQKKIDEYFDSCMGKVYTKFGAEIVDRDTGKPVMAVVKPYTLSGLARYIGLSTSSLKAYEKSALAGRAPMEFAQIILSAKQRIEEYAEGKCYDRDGSRGAEFVLRAGFNWKTDGELFEEDSKKFKNSLAEREFELKREQFELKKSLIDQGIGGEDDGINIVITRAEKEES